MSEVKRTGSSSSVSQTTGPSEGSKRAGEGGDTFVKALEASAAAKGVERLEAIMEQINRQGMALARQRSFHALRKYKDLVKRFMQDVVDNLYTLKGVEGEDTEGRQRNENVSSVADKNDDHYGGWPKKPGQ